MLALEPLAVGFEGGKLRGPVIGVVAQDAVDEFVVVVKSDRPGVRANQGPKTALVRRTNGRALQCDPGDIGKGCGTERKDRLRCKGSWSAAPAAVPSMAARSPFPMGSIAA